MIIPNKLLEKRMVVLLIFSQYSHTNSITGFKKSGNDLKNSGNNHKNSGSNFKKSGNDFKKSGNDLRKS